MKNIYASYEGFQYCLFDTPYIGCGVARETFAKGLLKYGTYDEYHTFFEDSAADSISRKQFLKINPYNKILKFKRLSKLPDANIPGYKIIHFEYLAPDKEVIFRNLVRKKNIPVTRCTYTIATNAHLREFLDTCLLQYGGRPYDSIIVLSHAAKNVLLQYFESLAEKSRGKICYKGRVDIIPCGIECDDFSPLDKLQARSKWGLPADAVILLSNARIDHISKMNYHVLLDFMASLLNTVKANVMLVIAGADQHNHISVLAEYAEQLGIKNNVCFIANYKGEDKMSILSSADIFISLSDNLQESFGISIIEAMAAGLPVVCTDWNGYKDIVRDEFSGFRIPTVWTIEESPYDVLSSFRHPYDHSIIHRISRDVVFDMHELVEKVSLLIHNRTLRCQLGENARSEAVSRFSLKTIIRHYEELWEELSSQAEKDLTVYDDLSSLLHYDYPRHFKSYPTEIK